MKLLSLVVSLIKFKVPMTRHNGFFVNIKMV